MKKGKIPTPIWLLAPIAVLAVIVIFAARSESLFLRKLGPEYSYDIEQYSKIDPAMLVYRAVGEPIQTGLQQSRAVAAGFGKLYVVGDSKLAILEEGKKKEIELPREPTCIQIDNDGTLILGLTDHLALADADGVIQRHWNAPAENALMTSIAMDKDNVYAADAVNKLVWRFDRQGLVVNRIGAKETRRNVPGIVVPSPYFDIAMYPDGLLRVVNPGRHWVEAYTPNGDREWHWGKTSVEVDGFSGCCNPVSMVVLSDGNFVTCEKGLIRVKLYDPEGELIGIVAGPEQLGRTEPMRICQSPEQCGQQGFDAAVDAAGRVYVLDMLQNSVRVFEKK
ncbi:MAG: hypothetical protein LLF76_06775 [Planctomycetaceae bacterium]|nr:hypothetical protein [Planctomycetaceae bacterium]